nr:hypothetical protein [Pseudomonas syringae]QOQ33602.1 hypothetical protein [Pseudomonas syringae pv. actinidiae]
MRQKGCVFWIPRINFATLFRQKADNFRQENWSQVAFLMPKG